MWVSNTGGVSSNPERRHGSIIFDPEAEHPELLPKTTASGRRVAFQRVLSPWRIIGSTEVLNSFVWDRDKKSERHDLSRKEKREIRAELEQYASKHGIRVRGNNAVKLALLNEANLWVSYAGGASSNLVEFHDQLPKFQGSLT